MLLPEVREDVPESAPANVKAACTPARCRCPFTHTSWQAQVVDLCHALGYDHLHVRKSIGKGRTWQTTTNLVGWPDILAFGPGRGFVGLELKVGSDKPTVEQLAVLAKLEAAGARTMVAYPHDLDAVHAILASQR